MSEGKVTEGQTWIPFSASLHPFRGVCVCVCVCVCVRVCGGMGRDVVHQAKCLTRRAWTDGHAVPAAASDQFADDVAGWQRHRQTAAENFFPLKIWV